MNLLRINTEKQWERGYATCRFEQLCLAFDYHPKRGFGDAITYDLDDLSANMRMEAVLQWRDRFGISMELIPARGRWTMDFESMEDLYTFYRQDDTKDRLAS